MDPVSEIVPCSSIRVFLMMENRLLREALIRLFRKRSDLVVLGHDGSADATACQVHETQFDVLVTDSFQTAWPAAKSARETGGRAAYKAVLIGMELDEELFMAAIRAGVMGYLLKDASASDLVPSVLLNFVPPYSGSFLIWSMRCLSSARPPDPILPCASSS